MKYIAVMGNKLELPLEFPTRLSENSGNLVHANAPFLMFNNCVYIREDMAKYGENSFINFVNNKCSHLVITLANTLRLGKEDGTGYATLADFLEKVTVPVVVFGLGVQTKNFDVEAATLPQEAIRLLKILSEKSKVVGVRGDFTRQVIERLTGAKNIAVVGCPSFFSRAMNYRKLLEPPSSGNASYAGTNFVDPREFKMLINSIKNDEFLIEPSNRFLHAAYVDSVRTRKAEYPYFFKKHPESLSRITTTEFTTHLQKNYRCFRNLTEWFNFNEELVNFTYGTRFHVNMASILSGVKAVWVTHDVRTHELTSLLSLPAVTLDEAATMTTEELRERAKYEEFFDTLDANFDNFNNYLRINDLPVLAKPVLN